MRRLPARIWSAVGSAIGAARRILRRHPFTTVFVLLSVWLTLLTYALYEVEEQREADRRADRTALIERSDVRICGEVEKLKKAFRDQLQESFADLPNDLKVLGIPYTPEIEAEAKKELDIELRRFAATKCSTLPTTRLDE